jgi:hypothetical protein
MIINNNPAAIRLVAFQKIIELHTLKNDIANFSFEEIIEEAKILSSFLENKSNVEIKNVVDIKKKKN